jgi:hypothetical protein
VPGELEVAIPRLYITDSLAATTAAATVNLAAGFVLVTDIEIGGFLHSIATRYDLHVAVRNLSKGTVVFNHVVNKLVPPGVGDLAVEEKVTVGPLPATVASSLDALDALVVLRFVAGVNTAFQTATAQTVIAA